MPYLGKTPSQGVRSRYQFTPNAGATSLSGADANGDTLTFTDGNYVDVYLNGVMLKAGVDYVTTTANTIGSLVATVASDVVDVIVYDTFSLFGGTLEGNVKVNNGTLNVTGAVDFDSTLNVDGVVTTDGATHDGDVTFTGANYNVVWDKSDNALEFGDNAKAIFGAGDDLEIYHSGAASHIKETGTGNLKLEGTNIELNNGAGNKTYVLATDGGAVQLRYDDSPKLETTSSGIDVTGGIVADHHVNIGTGMSYQWGDSHERIEQSDGVIEFFTGNNEKMRLQGSTLLVGSTTAIDTTLSGGTPALQVVGSGFSAIQSTTRRDSGAYGPAVILAKSKNATVGSYTAVVDNDSLGSIIFIGDDGTDLDTYGATIGAEVNGTPGSNDMPTDLVFSTNGGTSTVTERLRIHSSGLFEIKNTSQNFGDEATIRGTTSTGGPKGEIAFKRESSGDDTSIVFRSSNNGTLNATAMTLNSDGCVGINVVPETSAVFKSLELGTLSLITPSNTNGRMVTNLYYDGAYKRKHTGVSLQYEQDNAGHIWYFDSSASADVGFSQTEMLRLDTSGNLKVALGNIQIGTAGKGIDFSQTSDASGMTNEILDDYEEGTWTPGITINDSASGISYQSVNGNYRKIGSLCVATGRVNLSSKGSSSGYVEVTGLPFTNNNVSTQSGMASLDYMFNFANLTINNLALSPAQNTTTAYIFYITTGGAISQANLNDNSQFAFTLSYFTT